MNIQEQLNSLIRGNPLSVDTYLREVCKNEHISDTKASMHIYMLKLDGNNRPRTCDFCDYLINRIVDYSSRVQLQYSCAMESPFLSIEDIMYLRISWRRLSNCLPS